MYNYDKILKKIEEDQKCRPTCIIGPTGPKGEKGEIGPTGPEGVPGTSVSILGTYDTYQDLINEHPIGQNNESYLVDGDLYVWSDNEQNWVNVGRIMGPTGPKGDTGTSLIKAAYIVTFNNGTSSDGIAISSNSRIPLYRKEIDTANIVDLDSNQNTIKFNEPGYYKISFTVSAYPLVKELDFNPDNDIVSIGFRESNTQNTYVGVGEWVFNGEAVELYAQGIVSIIDTNKQYELANLSKNIIFLNTPDIRNIVTSSYFSNSLVTLIIEYLGIK